MKHWMKTMALMALSCHAGSMYCVESTNNTADYEYNKKYTFDESTFDESTFDEYHSDANKDDPMKGVELEKSDIQDVNSNEKNLLNKNKERENEEYKIKVRWFSNSSNF